MVRSLILAVASGVAAAKEISQVPFSNWMSYMEDTNLVDIPFIPGSHNSATFRSRIAQRDVIIFGWARQQHLSIAHQLEAGVRFLDFRLRVASGYEVRLSHTVDTAYSLAGALNEVQEFLKNHSSEIVFIHVRRDFNHPFPEEKKELYHALINQEFFRSGLDFADITDAYASTTVKDVSGKVILLFTENSDDRIIPKDSSLPRLSSEQFYKIKDIWGCPLVGLVGCGKRRLNKFMQVPFQPFNGVQGIAIDRTGVVPPSVKSRRLNMWFLKKLKTDTRWNKRVAQGPVGLLLVDFIDITITEPLIRFNLATVDVHII